MQVSRGLFVLLAGLVACGIPGTPDDGLGRNTQAITASLSNGVAITGQSGGADVWTYYSISIPTGVTGVQMTYSGSGYCTLRYQQNRLPSQYDYSAVNPQGVSCAGSEAVYNIASGTLYLALVGLQSYYPAVSGYTNTSLKVTYLYTTLPGVASIVINPSSVLGGYQSLATVTLTAPAPVAFSVPITNTLPAVLTQYGSVDFSVGQISNTDGLFTSAVTSDQIATVTASSSGTSKSAQLTIRASTAISLSGLTLTPSTLTGGATSTGRVTLSGAAPSGGAVVSLKPLNTTLAATPASVTVAAGSTSATFPVTTSAVGAQTTVYIYAAYGSSLNTPLTLTPASTTCTPTTCAAQGKSCGSISNGCGGTIACGTCASPSTCGGGGVANVCGGTTTGTSYAVSVTAIGRSGETLYSSPAGISAAVGTTRTANFSSGTSVTLSVTNGRAALWTGACNSGDRETSSCTFTVNGAASVTGEVK